jgi:PAS domain S-box-containing protein
LVLEQDDQFRFTFLSTDLLTRSGFTSDSGEGHARWDQPGIDQASADWKSHKALCYAHEPFHDFLYRRFRDDGSFRWISVSGQPMFDAQGLFKGYRGTGKDVTARVVSEERILRLNALYAVLSATNEAVARTNTKEALFGQGCRISVDHGNFRKAWVG